MKIKENGFTLIEIIITIGLLSIVVCFLMMFFILNINSLTILKYNTELQFQCQYIMSFIANKIMESRNVEVIKTGTSSAKNFTSEISVSKISLRYGEYDHNCYIFEIRNYKVYYGNSYSYDSADVELGTYVKELVAAPYPEGKTFAQAVALKITICLIKNGQEYEAEQIIYMRNS